MPTDDEYVMKIISYGHFAMTPTPTKRKQNRLLQKLSSRKFLVAVAGVATSLATKNYAEAAAVASVYIGAEAAIDVKGLCKKIEAQP